MNITAQVSVYPLRWTHRYSAPSPDCKQQDSSWSLV